MTDHGGDTIVALATGRARAAIAVLRLSGPASRFVLETIAGSCPPPRQARLRRLRRPATGEILDHGLVLWLPGPGSFSGEDMAEFHLHGGHAVVAAVLEAILGLPHCRLAEPGEFSRRAFLAGKLDLSAAEGIADLVDAETEAQRRQALRQMDGALTATVEGWRDRLIACLAEVEAELDFSDEGDVVTDSTATAEEIAHIRDEMTAVLADGRRGERLREGFTVVIAGPPNAGKSTLLNRMLQREAAIVSPIAGTTRDIIEARLDFDGLPVVLVDTAGLRDTQDPLEEEGVRRARARAETADLVLALEAVDSPPQLTSEAPTARLFRVWTKRDLAPPPHGFEGIAISAKTGEGVEHLLDLLASEAARAVGDGSALVTRERHRRALTDAVEALQHYRGTAGPELLAEDLRLALRALGRVTGRVGVEDILDRVFSTFCIGK
ncbi:tRNA uridine-5-carboxymethylaminomethyl(34) synthesis GTPase MnmE [Chelatococcus sp. GCM10030263]|uniref:tRNA uridine-5-carboxymethylaminomethyl(34) synthesis GTPase MnmE n=1 Tax=Chelatococcus sp. GCM10030263 TaxID=3273387 RepID=UPI003619AA7F